MRPFYDQHSTEVALITATEELRLILDTGGNAALILVDLSAAFDTINHGLLRDRLCTIGIRGKALSLLSSFLSERSQEVATGYMVSPPFALPCGVPQGSSLSPTLFNLYVTPLASLVRSYGFALVTYADDTQIIISVSSSAS